ncbi:MAG TPA: TetR/AcrR family transcriptional regulator [Chryseolinea sp.]|nr:TetR/AcrR family transcriptional regulator [Chryseolinea sp.]
MDRAMNSLLWVEQGYQLFAQEGLEGIQVERLARILQLNKSGFYHYFGDLEGFCAQLVALHLDKVDLFLEGIRQCKRVDPDYLLLLARSATTVMFQVQLTRNKEHYSFYKTSEVVDERLHRTVHKLWSEFIGAQHNPDLSMRYFVIVRDMFYTRISFDNLNYKFLHDFAANAKGLIDQIAVQASHERSRSHD